MGSLVDVDIFYEPGVEITFKDIAKIINKAARIAVVLTKSLSAASPPKAEFRTLPVIALPIPPVLLDCIKIILTSKKHTRTNKINIT